MAPKGVERSVPAPQGLPLEMTAPMPPKVLRLVPPMWQKEAPTTAKVRRPAPMVGEALRIRANHRASLNTRASPIKGGGRDWLYAQRRASSLSTVRQIRAGGGKGRGNVNFGGGEGNLEEAGEGQAQCTERKLGHVFGSHAPTILDEEICECWHDTGGSSDKPSAASKPEVKGRWGPRWQAGTQRGTAVFWRHEKESGTYSSVSWPTGQYVLHWGSRRRGVVWPLPTLALAQGRAHSVTSRAGEYVDLDTTTLDYDEKSLEEGKVQEDSAE
ncbi:hypothetical protein NDU88_008489 [Pleurodeles waltl]|uniref:Uncharacterized protein n=1 Tax=Pleurodeles waltl TaxID=8319 RepID=A0AAV7RUS5_PLEWA|nr:hypothetical protein NDU88_008489 [Pleurodeles waltl]